MPAIWLSRSTWRAPCSALAASFLFGSFSALWGLSTYGVLSAAFGALGLAALAIGLGGGGEARLPAAARPLLTAYLFILFWIPVWLLPWPAWIIGLVSPFRRGVFRPEESIGAGGSLFFSGQDAVLWLACAWGVGAAFLVGLHLSRGRSFRYFLAGLFGVGVLVASVALVLYGLGVALEPGVPHAGNLRLRGPFPNPDRFAGWLSMLLLLGIGVSLSAQGSRAPQGRASWRGAAAAASAAGVVLLFVAVVLTASRGALLVLLVLFPYLAIALRRWRFGPNAAEKGGASTPFNLLLLGAALALMATAAVWALAGRLVALPAELRRIEMWKSVLPMVRDFAASGVGPGAFYRLYPWYQPVEMSGRYLHAHSEPLELAAELGVPGMILLVCLGWWLQYAFWRNIFGKEAWREPLTAAVSAAVFAAVLHSLFDFPLRQPANLFLWSALLGVLSGRLAAYSADGQAPDGLIWLPARCGLPVGAMLVFSGVLVAAAHVCARGGGEKGLLSAAGLLPPGERYVAAAQREAYLKFIGGKLAPERFEALNRLALKHAGEDPFVLYRAAVAAQVAARPSEADRLMLLASRAGAAYRDLNHAVAVYFWQRYWLSGTQHGIFFRSLREVLERLPGEALVWAERFLAGGIPETLTRGVLDDRYVFEYGRLLARLGRHKEALERLEEAVSRGDERALPYAAGLWLAAAKSVSEPVEKGEPPGAYEKAERYWQQALADPQLPVPFFIEAVTMLKIREAGFLRPLLEKSAVSSATLRWYVDSLGGLDPNAAFIAARLLMQRSSRPPDMAVYIRAAAAAGQPEAAWRALYAALRRSPASAELWECLPALLQPEPAPEVLARLAELEAAGASAPVAVVARLAGICSQKGLPREAILYAEAALRRGYHSKELVNLLAIAYRQLGLPDAAAATAPLAEEAAPGLEEGR